MKLKQIEQALPIYNKLFIVNKEIQLIKAFQRTISEKSMITLSFHSKPGEDIKIEEIWPEFGRALLKTLLDYKEMEKIRLLDQLEKI